MKRARGEGRGSEGKGLGVEEKEERDVENRANVRMDIVRVDRANVVYITVANILNSAQQHKAHLRTSRREICR